MKTWTLHTETTDDGELTRAQDARLHAAVGDVDLTATEPEEDPRAAAYELYWDGRTSLRDAGLARLCEWLDEHGLDDIGVREGA